MQQFVADVRRVSNSDSSTEATYYPYIRELWNAVLKRCDLPYELRQNVSLRRATGNTARDNPDLAIYEQKSEVFLAPIEVKLPAASINELCTGTGRNNQVGRYLAQAGLVLVTNIRQIALVTATHSASIGVAVDPQNRRIDRILTLWESAAEMRAGTGPADNTLDALADLLEFALTRHAPIREPETLARVLARQARLAKAALPASFTDAVKPLLQDFGKALGVTFEGEEGESFFRSSLIQTAFYGIFASWACWHRDGRISEFRWQDLGQYLRIPFLGELFHEFQHPTRLRELNLSLHLDIGTETLLRVDAEAFFEKFRTPDIRGELSGKPSVSGAAAAVTYFYEPFLEAFDPDLRRELGVWYTPPEIVKYQVRHCDQLLRSELGIGRGFADERVVVLDPCCGTGAYVIEVLRCIAGQLHDEGNDAMLGARLLDAFKRRVVGFEILTAPFVVAQLQLYLILDELGAASGPGERERPAVFLTNALTGWGGGDQLKVHFPELQQEYDAARKVKQSAKIIVVLGNPPYNRFAGVPMAEERDLADHYKGITRNAAGKQVGKTRLFAEYGIRKHLLDDLYIRFFRMAERCIGERAEFGMVSFISNYSYLAGRSHPLMRESLVHNFDHIWIDSLNGDKYRTGKVIPRELPGGGTVDQSVFTTEQDSRGIQVGTAICTMLKIPASDGERTAQIYYRDFWGNSAAKRAALLIALNLERMTTKGRASIAQTPAGPRKFECFAPTRANRWKFAPRDDNAGFDEWPALDELFRENFMGVNTGKDGGVIAFDSEELNSRFRDYLDPKISDSQFASICPVLMTKANEFNDPGAFRREMQKDAKVQTREPFLRPYVHRPLDNRTIFYETTRRVFGRGEDRWSGCLIQRFGEKFQASLGKASTYLVAVCEPRRRSEALPLVASTLFDLHLHDRGSTGFPDVFTPDRQDEFFGNSGEASVLKLIANIADKAFEKLKVVYGIKGGPESAAGHKLARSLIYACLAIGHAPQYILDHADALAHDWMHVPLPRQRTDFDGLVDVGDQLARLLNPLADVEPILKSMLGRDGRRTLAVPRRKMESGRNVEPRPEDLTITYSYFGGATGRWIPRDPVEGEVWNDVRLWGDRTGDLYLNENVYLAHVPEKIWRLELGGYPVLKKWMGYRQANRRNGAPLTIGELDHLRNIVQRLAAVIKLHPNLDLLYERVAADAFTADELGLR
jgi:hypothetical protein